MLRRILGASLKTLPIACTAIAALAIAGNANAQIVAPYTADDNTAFLYSFDEAGGGVAANEGFAGFNAVGFDDPFVGDDLDQPVVSVLGGAGFTGFGNAAVIGTGRALGVDADGSGGFRNHDADPSTSPDELAQSAILGTGSFTLEALVNVSGLGTQQEIISSDANGANDTRGFQFRINANSQLEFQYVGAGAIDAVVADITDTAVVGAGNEFVANEWFHAAVVFDASSDDPDTAFVEGETSLFFTRVDSGATEANLILSGEPDRIDLTDLGPLVIGNEGRAGNNAGNSGTGSVLSEALLGSIDEVRISNVARGADEFIFAAAVPEPSSLILLGLGGIVGLARRRKS